jgi:Protein of unknown function (DUF4232)
MRHRQDRTAAHTVIAATLLIGMTLGACGTPPPPTTAPATQPPSPSPTPTATLPSASPTAVSPTSTPPPASQPVGVELDASPSPAFAGDPVTLTVSGFVPDSTSLRIATTTVDFGDGSTATVSGSCAARVPMVHAYQRGEDYQPRVTALTGCGGSPATNIASTATTLHVFPSAPAVSAIWPVCRTFQLHLAGRWTGAGLGNVATQITITNVSAHACTLKGYPGVVLVGADGRLLATHATPATTGAYMFPAVVPHRVALAPGDVATFMLGYGGNPSGAEPYAVACPVASAVRVILPGTHEFGMAIVSIVPCEGLVQVSPIVPGADRLTF